MSDTAAAEAPAESVPPIPQAPEAAAELDAASPEAAPAEQIADAPALPFDVEHLGVLRRAVLDHLVDTDEPQSVAQIIAAMPPGTTRNSAETAVRREHAAGRIEKTAPGTYRLAAPKPPKPAEPTRPSPVAPEDEQVWFIALEAWIDNPETWDRQKLGPRPNEPGRRIPADIVARGVDRSRKREARRQDRELAQARQVAADAELRDRLISATGGNVIRTSALDDVGPIKLALQVVSIDRIVSSIRSKTHKKLFPGNEPAKSWSERRLLKAVAEDYCSSEIVPNLVAAWEARGRRRRPRRRARRRPLRCPTTQTSYAAATTPSTRQPGRTAWLSQMRRLACWRGPLMRWKRRPLSRCPPELEGSSTVPPANGTAPLPATVQRSLVWSPFPSFLTARRRM
jgi:hypothetical protein